MLATATISPREAFRCASAAAVMCTAPRYVDGQQPLVDREIVHRIEARPHGHAGVVDQHVERAEALQRARDAALAVVAVRDVAGDRLDLRTPRAALAHGLLEAHAVARRSTRFAPVGRELQGQRAARCPRRLP